jgi:REP element-mobilizing transposase RayT
MYSDPLAYFITARTYGTWHHGDARGSVDRVHNQRGTPLLAVDEQRVLNEQQQMKRRSIEFSPQQRVVVERAMRSTCEFKQWRVLAVNVRTNHAHIVVNAKASPERVMNTLKTWVTRGLIDAGQIERGVRPWSRHGSTVYLFTPEEVEEAIHYVLHGQ